MSSHPSEIVSYSFDSMEGLEFQDHQEGGPSRYPNNYQQHTVGRYQNSHSSTTHLLETELPPTYRSGAFPQFSPFTQSRPSHDLKWSNTTPGLLNSPPVAVVGGSSMAILPSSIAPTQDRGAIGYTKASVDHPARNGDLNDSDDKSDQATKKPWEHHNPNEYHDSALQKSEHVHWCTSREHDGMIKTCDGFKRHENEHEKYYVFMPSGPVEATSEGPRCALCGVYDPAEAHLAMHNIILYSKDRNPPVRKSRKGDFVKLLRKHKVPEIDLKGLVRKWHRSERKQSYSCGLCIKYFPTLIERSNHMCSEHFARGQDLSGWDENLVVKVHLCRPGLQEEWQKLFLGASDANVTWPLDIVEEVQQWLELGHETVQRLASMVFNERQTPMQRNGMNDPNDRVRAMESARTLVDFAQLDSVRQEGVLGTQEPFGDASEGLCLSVMPDNANQVRGPGRTPIVSSSPLHHPFGTFTNTGAYANTESSCAAPYDTAAEMLEPGRNVHTIPSTASSPSSSIQALEERQLDDLMDEEDFKAAGKLLEEAVMEWKEKMMRVETDKLVFEHKVAAGKLLEEAEMELEEKMMLLEKYLMVLKKRMVAGELSEEAEIEMMKGLKTIFEKRMMVIKNELLSEWNEIRGAILDR